MRTINFYNFFKIEKAAFLRINSGGQPCSVRYQLKHLLSCTPLVPNIPGQKITTRTIIIIIHSQPPDPKRPLSQQSPTINHLT
jgi:hypothetical protein